MVGGHWLLHKLDCGIIHQVSPCKGIFNNHFPVSFAATTSTSTFSTIRYRRSRKVHSWSWSVWVCVLINYKAHFLVKLPGAIIHLQRKNIFYLWRLTWQVYLGKASLLALVEKTQINIEIIYSLKCQRKLALMKQAFDHLLFSFSCVSKVKKSTKHVKKNTSEVPYPVVLLPFCRRRSRSKYVFKLPQVATISFSVYLLASSSLSFERRTNRLALSL